MRLSKNKSHRKPTAIPAIMFQQKLHQCNGGAFLQIRPIIKTSEYNC